MRNEITRGAGAILCAEELLTSHVRQAIKATLDEQPAWSDLPVIVVATNWESFGERLVALSRLRSVSILGRPMAIDTIVTAVKSALQARSRQYEVRNLLIQRDEAAKRKDEFLAMLAHELRNPLSPIRYSMQVPAIGMRSKTSDDGCSYCSGGPPSSAHRSFDRRLVGFTRITSGVIALKLQTIDFTQLLNAVADSHSEVITSKGFHFKLENARQPLWVKGTQYVKPSP